MMEATSTPKRWYRMVFLKTGLNYIHIPGGDGTLDLYGIPNYLERVS